MTKPKETYSTEKAWGYSSSDQAETVYWRNMAKGLRKRVTSQRMYIEKLEQKIESLESLNERARH
jgi:hypothetical protein